MSANFSKKGLLVTVLAFFMIGSIPAFAQTHMGGEVCHIEMCYIKVTDEGFIPERMTINPGSTIVWKNVDDKAHSLEIISGESRTDPVILRSGEMYSYRFVDKEQREFSYFDAENRSSGQLIVGPVHQVMSMNNAKIDFTDDRSGISDISLVRGSISGAEIIPELRALLINASVDTYGVLYITLDRNLLDSKSLGKDVPFSIRVNDNIVAYTEIGNSSESRTLRFTVPGDTETILIRGNVAVTEPFGYQDAYSTLSVAASVIASYKAKGVVMNDADDLLLQATEAAAKGKYFFARDLGGAAIETAHRADRIAGMASAIMDEAETSIMATKNLGADVSQAEELLFHTREIYSYGGYEEALSLANYARDAALTTINPLLIIGMMGMSAAFILYMFYYRKQPRNEKEPKKELEKGSVHTENETSSVKENGTSLESIFLQKPHLREDDRLVLKYIIERGGQALLAEIRNTFSLPKSTAWRLMRRLEREELVEITKFGNQNMIRYNLKAEAYL